MHHSHPDDDLVLPAAPTRDPEWLLVEEGFTLAREHEIESIFAVANGYMGTRGSLAEDSPMSAPATFIAGVFDVPPQSRIPELVSAPDWLRLHVTVDGRELSLDNGEVLEHRRVLDLRQGILWREWRQRDPAGRITHVHGMRLASLADRHVLVQSVAFTPENYGGRVLLESSIEGAPHEAESPSIPTPVRDPATSSAASPPGAPGAVDVLSRSTLLDTSTRSATSPTAVAARPRIAMLSFRIASTGVEIAFASATRLTMVSAATKVDVIEDTASDARHRWTVDMRIGETYRLDRVVGVFTSRDVERPADAAAAHIARLLAQSGVDRIVMAHVQAWLARWRTSDVQVSGDTAAQRALRFAIYHLIGAANADDERVSIGARMLTGSTYQGHVFWDTEIFMLPFYVLTHPASARALLMYRYHTLPAARERASSLGYRGALYPWESAATGEDVTPRFGWFPDGTMVEILTGTEEHHISADVAYAVWQYWRATGDDAFLLAAGAEILLDTARFWASRGTLEADGRYHIRHVIGPDEYHENVDDDAYTNLMAQWNLEHGATVAELLETRWPESWREISRALALTADEVREWRRLAEAMYTGFDAETGLYEQFAGYSALEDIDLAAHEPRTAPIDVILGRERIQRSQVNKQADVIMAIYLLWDRFPHAVREANFRYYEPRTSHGSSLSPAIHALVAARLGDRVLAARYFREAADIDLADNMGSAAGGVHAAALGGLWQAAVFGFAGVQLRDGGIVMAPRFPPGWHAMRATLQWRGQILHVTVTEDPPRIEVQLEGDGVVPLALVDGPEGRIGPGRGYVSERTPDGWGRWQERAP